MELPLEIIALVFLVFWSAYFSSSETALFSLSATRVKAYQDSTDARKKLIARLLQQPKDLLVTIFMLNTLVNILLQNVASSTFGSSASWALKVGAPLLITLLLGEIIPKNLGMQHNVAISYHTVVLTNLCQQILTPVRKLIIAITFPLSRLLFFFLRKEETISKDELFHVLQASEKHEIVHKDEAELICGWLNLQDASVKEVMRPRQEVIAYDIDDPLAKLTHLFVDRECSRIPVCKGSLENVLGIITAQEFFLHREEMITSEALQSKLAKPFYVPENTLARLLLRRFDEYNEEIALVVDEYGSIAGLIAREDILEVVIGQIEDLRDSKTLYTKQSDNEIIASGKLELSEFNELFQSNFVSENNMITLGGWLTEMLGEIPQAGTKYETADFFFQVLTAEKNRIRRVYVRGPDPKQKKL